VLSNGKAYGCSTEQARHASEILSLMFCPRHWRSGADETSREIRAITSQGGRCTGEFSELKGEGGLRTEEENGA